MTNPDGSPLEWIAKLPMFSWMRSKARDDHGHSDVPDLCGLDMKGKEPRQQQQQQQQPPKQQRSSPPQLCTKEESVSQTAPASTCDSSGASWSDMAVGSSDSSVGATHDMVTFHRLSEGVDGGPRRSPPPLTLTVDPEPALAPTAPPVDIPWRVVDPDSVSNPMQEVRVLTASRRRKLQNCLVRPGGISVFDLGRAINMCFLCVGVMMALHLLPLWPPALSVAFASDVRALLKPQLGAHHVTKPVSHHPRRFREAFFFLSPGLLE